VAVALTNCGIARPASVSIDTDWRLGSQLWNLTYVSLETIYGPK